MLAEAGGNKGEKKQNFNLCLPRQRLKWEIEYDTGEKDEEEYSASEPCGWVQGCQRGLQFVIGRVQMIRLINIGVYLTWNENPWKAKLPSGAENRETCSLWKRLVFLQPFSMNKAAVELNSRHLEVCWNPSPSQQYPKRTLQLYKCTVCRGLGTSFVQGHPVTT